MSGGWLLVAILLPALAALAVGLAGRWPNLREAVAVVAGLILIGILGVVVGPVIAGARPEITLFDILPGLGLMFRAEPIGLLFALVAAGLWPVTTVYAAGYMRGHHETGQTRFFIFFAVAIAATMGIALAGNLLTLFVFYELLTLGTFPLVTHHGDADARGGGRMYLGILMGTSIGLFLPAIVATWWITGTTSFTAGGVFGASTLGAVGATVLYTVFIYGIGKAALMPVHRWLPAAMVAPTPVSALLHAVAVVKAGVFSVLKITVYIFGLDYAYRTGATDIILWLATATVLIASLVAMTCDNLKKRLAYSTISQLSYIVLGAALATPLGIIGAGMHIATHAVGKITLFFCAGAINTASHKTRVSQLNGLGRAMPYTFAAFTVAALSIIGLPPLAGIWSKWWLMRASIDAGHGWLIAVLAFSSMLNIIYLLDIPTRAFFLPARDGEDSRYHEAPKACVVPLVLTAIACVVLFFAIGPVIDLIQSAVSA